MTQKLVFIILIIFPALFFLGAGLLILLIPNIQLPFTRSILDRERRGIEELLKNIKAAEQSNKSLANELKPMFLMRKTACEDTEEKADGIFRERVEGAALESGVKLRSIGQTKKTLINGKTVLYELSLATADCRIDELSVFLENLNVKTPCVYLKNLSITPDNAAKPESLVMNGTLCMLCFVKEKKE